MFFTPIEVYLKALFTTLIVETSLFAVLISKKPINLLAVLLFNISSNVLLHIYFHYCVVLGFTSTMAIWIAGEILVVIYEALAFYYSKIITPIKRAALFSLLFNIASIIVGRLISLFIY